MRIRVGKSAIISVTAVVLFASYFVYGKYIGSLSDPIGIGLFMVMMFLFLLVIGAEADRRAENKKKE